MIHVIIAAERRKAPRELAISIQGQLHSMGASVADIDSPQITYAAEWDLKSPWVTVLKGKISDLKMAYLGWPMVDEATWKAAQPVVKL